MSTRRAIIIGAGPAGLTAAYELVTRTDIQPVIIEASADFGGLSRTVNYKGNRLDIGGHRFFSLSDRVMKWWLNILPLDPSAGVDHEIRYQGASRRVTESRQGPVPPDLKKVMLLRPRKSRIYYGGRLFDYPISLKLDTFRKLGIARSLHILVSYLRSAAFPDLPEDSLEKFIINRFGRQLYRMFFQSYTEKVWGTPCSQISAEWGAQRIKGVSIRSAVSHAVRDAFSQLRIGGARQVKHVSFADQFLYPRLGPGQMWEEVARLVEAAGGTFLMKTRLHGIHTDGSTVVGVESVSEDGQTRYLEGDILISTIPVGELVGAFVKRPPANVMEVSEGLRYRDFITVGLLVRRLGESLGSDGSPVLDNWIYIHEPGVKLGRLQFFNNWSADLVSDPARVWLGLEYFCAENSELWRMSDTEMIQLGAEELRRLGIIAEGDVLDGTVVRVPKAYPAYVGSYHRFAEIPGVRRPVLQPILDRA